MLSRRTAIGSLIALAAPAVIRTPGLLMPVKVLQPRETLAYFHDGRELVPLAAEGPFPDVAENFARSFMSLIIRSELGRDAHELPMNEIASLYQQAVSQERARVSLYRKTGIWRK